MFYLLCGIVMAITFWVHPLSKYGRLKNMRLRIYATFFQALFWPIIVFCGLILYLNEGIKFNFPDTKSVCFGTSIFALAFWF